MTANTAVARGQGQTTPLVPGVKNVVEISRGIAVVADNTWSAMKGRRKLKAVWDNGPHAVYSSEEFKKETAKK